MSEQLPPGLVAACGKVVETWQASAELSRGAIDEKPQHLAFTSDRFNAMSNFLAAVRRVRAEVEFDTAPKTLTDEQLDARIAALTAEKKLRHPPVIAPPVATYTGEYDTGPA